jgi:peptidoglycan LD-endopeptidase LytH
MKRKLNRIFQVILGIIILGFFIPFTYKMPVDGATKSSYHQSSFWAHPWGESGTHKGVDIFAKKGTLIHSSTIGLVVYTGEVRLGGSIVLVMDPKWRFHYYAHLKDIQATQFSLVNTSSPIGTIGTTGNAVGKEPHLHYAIKTFLPYFWNYDNGIQGWKKMFYINPIPLLNKSFE